MTVSEATIANGSTTPKRQLFPSHLEQLLARGLSHEMIGRSGLYSLGNVTELAIKLGWKSYPRKMGSALVIPYYFGYGTAELERLRPDNPRVNKRTKRKIKYEQPSGQPPRLYFPPGTDDALTGAGRIIFTEGEFKALLLTQHGFPAVAIGGVEMWHGKRKTTLLPDFARINLKGREVFIVFDSDITSNENVARCEREFAAALVSQGAVVKVVRLPDGPNKEKHGADDFLKAQGPGEFEKLLQRAESPEEPDTTESRENAEKADPADEADYILSTCKIDGHLTLRIFRGVPYRWRHGCYHDEPLDELRARITNLMNESWANVKSHVVSNVLEQVKAKAMLPGQTESPCWLSPGGHEFPAHECIATRSEVIHVPSLVAGSEQYSLPATPNFFTTTACEFDLDPAAPEPTTWLRFLDTLWGNDSESVKSLQEWFGYLIGCDTRLQKMLLLVGPKRSGKGTIARILTALVGKGNVAAPTLGGLATNFGMWPLIGKSVAIISDARLSGRADQAAVVERLLSISGEDSITVDRKNMQPITCRLPTQFVILTNELPRLSDASGALVSRVILLATNQSFYGREDHDLTDKLFAEIPAILLWAIVGWSRLKQRGRFLQPASGAELIGDMNDLSSPVTAFLRERCLIGHLERVATSELFAAWCKWCEAQGRGKLAGNVQGFGRDLLAAEPSIRRSQPREHGERVRIYQGIGLRSEWT